MKQMKIILRLATGILGSIALTSFILFALDAYLAGQASSHQTVRQDSDATDKTGSHIDPDTALAKNTPEDGISIGSSERHMLYQPQQASSAEDTARNSDPVSPQQAKKTPDTDNQLQSDKDLEANGKQPSDEDTQLDSKIQSGQDKPSGSKIQSRQDNPSGSKTQSGQDDTPDSKTQSGQDKPKPSQEQSSDNKQPSNQDGTSESDKQTNKKKQSNTKKQSDKQPSAKGHTSSKKKYTFQTVTEDYFSDALFIGDSRTVGMLQSQLLPESCYYAKTGIGIGDILSERIVNEGGSMISVSDALGRHTFGKVYIMIGINDISCGDVDWFLEQYKKILETVARTQPDAIIYIQANIPMSYGTQDLHGALNNHNLALRNEASSTLADSKTIFYLDISQVYADANGNLASLYTRDGLHVSPNYYALWVDYLLHHAIVHN